MPSASSSFPKNEKLWKSGVLSRSHSSRRGKARQPRPRKPGQQRPQPPLRPQRQRGPKRAPEAAGVAPAEPEAAREAAGAAPVPSKGAPEQAPLTPATEAKGGPSQKAPAAASEQAKGQSVAGDFVLGVRAGAIVPTQQILENLSSGTSAGPLVNLEAYYVVREWVRLGLMLEWQRYRINARDAEVGTLTTFSLLPA